MMSNNEEPYSGKRWHDNMKGVKWIKPDEPRNLTPQQRQHERDFFASLGHPEMTPKD